jgi:hypothetical protein
MKKNEGKVTPPSVFNGKFSERSQRIVIVMNQRRRRSV